MSRFFVDPAAVKGDRIIVTGKEAHHILDVMRLTVSDRVTVFDGTGAEYRGVIAEAGPRSVTVSVTEVRRQEAAACAKVLLIQAVTKKDKMDYIVEKATELGVDTIVPVAAGRTIPHWGADKMASRLRRWAAIAREAAKQCGRADVPRVEAVTGMAGALRHAEGCALRLIAALTDDARPLSEFLGRAPAGDVAIAVGPEGDFTPDEVAMARAAGFSVVSLGPRVLKSDTAGLALLAMVDYALAR